MLSGWGLNLNPTKKTKPQWYGVIPPVEKTKQNWDETADKFIGKIVSADHVYKDNTFEDWFHISLHGDPQDETASEWVVFESAVIHTDYLHPIPKCTCDFKRHWGCRCGAIIAEKKFKAILKERVQK